jgi:large subunit ribosomal protein L1
MRHIGKIAKLLWPKWLMPNPKTGTVSPNIESAIKEIAWWKFEFKTDKQWNVHSIFWKLSFWDKKLEENLSYFIKTINDVKPTWSKWIYINSIFVCNSMWPSIKIEN